MLEPVQRRGRLVRRDRHRGGGEHAGDGGVDAGKQDRVPEQGGADQIEREARSPRAGPARTGPAKIAAAAASATESSALGIGQGDDRHRAEIVGDGDGGRGRASARPARGVPSKASTPSAKAMSVAAGIAQPRAQRRLAARRWRDRSKRAPPCRPPAAISGSRRRSRARQLAADELALDLQPDEQEEQRHQAVVDPQHGRSSARARRSGPARSRGGEVPIGVARPLLAASRASAAAADQKQPARRLGIEKAADRRWFALRRGAVGHRRHPGVSGGLPGRGKSQSGATASQRPSTGCAKDLRLTGD